MTSLRLRPGVRFRSDAFGGMCYVPHRDDMFALSRGAYAALTDLPRGFTAVDSATAERLRSFIELGIAEATESDIRERAYSGPSLIGAFPELPTVTHPLVVNCFATAWCPLLCRYCHADDLMTQGRRTGENEGEVDNVLATARELPALVAVITGGDPLSAPDRTRRLIEGLFPSKAIVVDTSGLGPVETLLPVLKSHGVHVRVSLDNALAASNDFQRPVNRRIEGKERSAWSAARECIERLLEGGVPVTVQTVVTGQNDKVEDWLRLREVLVEWGVRHWVLHVVVAGGKARAIEERASRNPRASRVRPSPGLGGRLWELVRDTEARHYPIDIRCTDTDDRPNSVLLIASNGDLFTEGFARKGKVPLFAAESGQPDMVQALMAHLDRFGHARRYLNWNPWYGGGRSIEEICIPFPEPLEAGKRGAVETEFKFRVTDVVGLRASLEAARFRSDGVSLQRDEYFDTVRGLARTNDYVIRLRKTDSAPEVALKGPRFFSVDGASSRLELEVPVASMEEARAALQSQGLVRTWFLEKRREELSQSDGGVKVALDEVPTLGHFIELEGGLDEVRTIARRFAPFLGSVEKRNYRELAIATSPLGEELKGVEFVDAAGGA
jgi:predicted adenylyl cyclase CyaB